MRLREFIAILGSAAAACPVAARAQQSAMPIVAFINGFSAKASTPYVTAFRNGLSETGHVEGQNVAVEYHFRQGQYDHLQALMADVTRRQVSVIATPASLPPLRPRFAHAGSTRDRRGPRQLGDEVIE